MPDQILLIYRSIARWPDFDLSDLAILRTAIRFNRSAGISGFLWRGNGQFFQVLHGPRAITRALIERIARDDRHHDVNVFLDRPAGAESAFPTWSMGYDHFLETELGLERDPDGGRPQIDAARAEAVLGAMVRAFEEVRRYGSAYPYSRRPGEDEEAYLARIETAA